MNRTEFDLKQITNNFPEVDNLGQLLNRLEQEFSKKGEVICRFIINDLDLTEEDEIRIAGAPIDEIQKVGVESESPAILLFSLLNNWIQELPELILGIDSLAKDIKFQGIEGRLKRFIDLVDSCQYLIESLMNLESILRKESMGLDQWQNAKIMTARAIGDALSAFEKKDFVQLSEVLEYDLASSLQEWLEEIKRMKEQLKIENDKNSQEFAARIFEGAE